MSRTIKHTYINAVLSVMVLVLVVFCVPASAQQKDSTLQEISVQGKKNLTNDVKVNEFSPGQKIRSIDSITLQQYQLQSMDALLAQQSSVFVKSYGINGLATLNFRGASAAQSMVLWNGVPLQNAALGMADVSTIPVLLLNKVSLVYGGSSALWGSGNVGGALLLENENPVFEKGKRGLSASVGAGSFGQYMGALKGSISGHKYFFSVSAFGQNADNDFSYTGPQGQRSRMQNATLQSGSVLLHAAVIDSPMLINAYLWVQQYSREIPPALFEAFSAKKRVDGSTRLLVDWQRKVGKSDLNGKLSYIADNVSYTDDAVQVNMKNNVKQIYLELGWRKHFGRYGQLLLFTPCQLSWGSAGFKEGDTVQQERAGVAAAYDIKLFRQRLNVALNVREEVIDTRDVFLAGGSLSLRLTDWLALKANVQKTYRTPTLNELYYFPGGNKDLKPEHGFAEDGGYSVKARAGKVAVFHDLSVFNRDINDWIYWVGGAIWTPHNIAEVNSRGVETENKLSYPLGKWKLQLGANTSYVLATTVSSYILNEGSIGKQIPYSPRYNGQLNAGFTYGELIFNYNHSYTGYRFTTTDESAYLLPYQTGNVQVIYNLSLNRYALQFLLSCNNIWNERYEVVAQRPMPGTNWQLGIKAQL